MARIPNGPKLDRNTRLAPGHWSSPYKVLSMYTVGERIRTMQQDKLTMMGRQVYLYLPVADYTPSIFLGNAAEVCYCTWSTNEAPEEECLQCYGTKRAPGYVRFGWQTVHATTTEVAPERTGGPRAWVFTNTAVNTMTRPYRIELVSGATTGTFTTTDRTYTNPGTIPLAPTDPGPVDWDTRVDASLRAPTGSSVVVEFSTNAGVTWTNLTLINGPNRPIGTGVSRFRVTLTRATASDPSPGFDAIRMRRRRIEGVNEHIQRQRRVLQPRQLVTDEYQPGEILILRTVDDMQTMLDRISGRKLEAQGDRGWTSPLDFFDHGLTLNTPDCRLREDDGGPHPFYQHTSGILSDRRFSMTQIRYSEEIGGAGGGLFTSQSWDSRQLQKGETGWNVW